MVKILSIGAIGALLSFGIGGCVGLRCERYSAAEPMLSIWHSSGGPGPVVTSVTITSDFVLLYKGARGTLRCDQLDAEEVKPLLELADQNVFRQEAEDAEARGASYFDYEELEIRRDSWSVAMPLELAPPRIHDLLDRVDLLLKRYLESQSPWGDAGL